MSTSDSFEANWLPRPVNYKAEATKYALAKVPATHHPLGSVVNNKSCDSESLTSRVTVDTESQSHFASPISLRFDPLSTPPRPESSLLGSSNKNESQNVRHNSQSMLRDVPEKAATRTPWQLKKDQILASFAMPVTEITWSASSSQDIEKSPISSAGDNRYDKYSQRLALLGRKSTSSGKEVHANSNDSYSRRIEVSE